MCIGADIPVVVLCGSHYERGVQHGSRFAQKIDLGIKRRLAVVSRADLRRAYEWAKTTIEAIGSVAPDAAAELRGIADGSGRDVLDIVLQNSFEFFAPAAEIGCSALAVRTADGVVVAQNWDAPAG